MELKLSLDYNQLLSLIKQLPASQIAKLRIELGKKYIEEKPEKTVSSDFRKFLLSGPVMSDEQYNAYVENRERMSQWRPK